MVFSFFIKNITDNFYLILMKENEFWYDIGEFITFLFARVIINNRILLSMKINIPPLNVIPRISTMRIVYLPKKALKTKSNFFLRNSDSGIFGPCGIKKRERVKCVRSVNIRSRSSDDQGRLSRATDPSFISRVKSNRSSRLYVWVYIRPSCIHNPARYSRSHYKNTETI